MSIPLDHLYHYINNIAEKIYKDRVIIYRFYPHGSKNLENFETLYTVDPSDLLLYPTILCADQEPLNYDYSEETIPYDPFAEMVKPLDSEFVEDLKNLKSCSYIYLSFNNGILLHSEKRSLEVTKYQNDIYIPTYYWSHAVIALDWYRYAQHVSQQKNVNQTFLIYNRAWAGTREYRLKFTELLIENNLIDHCRTSLNAVEPELNIHYLSHKFDNPVWRPSGQIEDYLQPTSATSDSSADFDIEDYNSTDIEVVLETLFDDSRLHLTEKSLRPIALGQPFILMSTHGSLQYLKDYGFQTFESIIDESYDQIENPVDRMQAVVKLMCKIASWSKSERIEKMSQLQVIADYNREYFFSDTFFNVIINELQTNLKNSMSQPLISMERFKNFIDKWKQYLEVDEIKFFLSSLQKEHERYYPKVIEFLKQAENRYQQLSQLTPSTNSV